MADDHSGNRRDEAREYHNLGNDYYRIDDFEHAIEQYNKAIELDPSNVETFFNRALAYTREGRYIEAEKDLDHVIEVDYSLSEAWYTRGLVKEYMRQFDEATKDYEQAVKLGGEHGKKAKEQIAVAKRKKEGSQDPSSGRDMERDERRRREFKELHAMLEKRHDLPEAERPAWQECEERPHVVEFFRNYGWYRTNTEVESRGLIGREDEIAATINSLLKMTRTSCVMVGPPGVGKSSIVYELAHRIRKNDPSIPESLHDCDIFEISSTYFQSGTVYRGEYEENVTHLIQIMELCPEIILFIDEFHAFFQPSFERDGGAGFDRANQAFKMVIADGRLSIIGATTWTEYRRFIEPDGALARRLDIIRVEEPSRQETLEILKARKSGLEKHHHVEITDEHVARAIDACEDNLPDRHQPDVAIQLLDTSCGFAAMVDKPLGEAFFKKSLETILGRPVREQNTLDADDIYAKLRRTIVGQDAPLRWITNAVVSSLGVWADKRGPRGVFLFAGPTGVGKTETSLRLAGILAGGHDAFLRIDCNTLQGWNAAGQLLGAGQGSAGYLQGKGGLLSKVRDIPEAVVLFDEIEKADPTVGQLLLQIMDEGKVRDSDDNLLDFRKAFLIFTTNAGARYDAAIGFDHAADQEAEIQVDETSLRRALLRRGLGEEFIGRMDHVFLFNPLTRAAVREIIHNQLVRLDRRGHEKGLDISWQPAVERFLAEFWDPRYGARDVENVLNRFVVERLNLAQMKGSLQRGDLGRIEVEGRDLKIHVDKGMADLPDIRTSRA